MGDAEKSVVLTDREREALAGLAESIGDPWLARQLAGQEAVRATTPRPRRSAADRMGLFLAPVSGWVGLLLVLAGAALAVTTFARSTVVASLGLAMMGAGLGRLVIDKGDGLIRRVAARWPQVSPKAAPPPPRTPPAAA